MTRHVLVCDALRVALSSCNEQNKVARTPCAEFASGGLFCSVSHVFGRFDAGRREHESSYGHLQDSVREQEVERKFHALLRSNKNGAMKCDYLSHGLLQQG